MKKWGHQPQQQTQISIKCMLTATVHDGMRSWTMSARTERIRQWATTMTCTYTHMRNTYTYILQAYIHTHTYMHTYTHTCIHTYTHAYIHYTENEVSCVAISQDGVTMASAEHGDTGMIYVWDSQTMRITHILDPVSPHVYAWVRMYARKCLDMRASCRYRPYWKYMQILRYVSLFEMRGYTENRCKRAYMYKHMFACWKIDTERMYRYRHMFDTQIMHNKPSPRLPATGCTTSRPRKSEQMLWNTPYMFSRSQRSAGVHGRGLHIGPLGLSQGEGSGYGCCRWRTCDGCGCEQSERCVCVILKYIWYVKIWMRASILGSMVCMRLYIRIRNT